MPSARARRPRQQQHPPRQHSRNNNNNNSDGWIQTQRNYDQHRCPTLDLHGHTLQTALRAVTQFLDQHQQQGKNNHSMHRNRKKNIVRIVTGTGQHSLGGPVLRGAVRTYLDRRSFVVVEERPAWVRVDVTTGVLTASWQAQQRQVPVALGGSSSSSRHAVSAAGTTSHAATTLGAGEADMYSVSGTTKVVLLPDEDFVRKRLAAPQRRSSVPTPLPSNNHNNDSYRQYPNNTTALSFNDATAFPSIQTVAREARALDRVTQASLESHRRWHTEGTADRKAYAQAQQASLQMEHDRQRQEEEEDEDAWQRALQASVEDATAVEEELERALRESQAAAAMQYGVQQRLTFVDADLEQALRESEALAQEVEAAVEEELQRALRESQTTTPITSARDTGSIASSGCDFQKNKQEEEKQLQLALEYIRGVEECSLTEEYDNDYDSKFNANDDDRCGDDNVDEWQRALELSRHETCATSDDDNNTAELELAIQQSLQLAQETVAVNEEDDDVALERTLRESLAVVTCNETESIESIMAAAAEITDTAVEWHSVPVVEPTLETSSGDVTVAHGFSSDGSAVLNDNIHDDHATCDLPTLGKPLRWDDTEQTNATTTITASNPTVVSSTATTNANVCFVLASCTNTSTSSVSVRRSPVP